MAPVSVPDVASLLSAPCWGSEKNDTQELEKEVHAMFKQAEMEGDEQNADAEKQLRALVASLIDRADDGVPSFTSILPRGDSVTGSGALMHIFVHGLHRHRHPVHRREVPLLILSWTSCAKVDKLVESGNLQTDDVCKTMVLLSEQSHNQDMHYLEPEAAAQLEAVLSANGSALGDVQGHPYDDRQELSTTGFHRSFLLPIYPDGGPTAKSTEEERIMQLKEEGNAFIKKSRYQEAVDAYEKAAAIIVATRGIDGAVINRDLWVVVHSNMAQANLHLEKWDSAFEAAEKVLEIDPGHEKTLMRKAKALCGMGKTEEAAKFLEAHLAVPALQAFFDELQQRIKDQQA